MKHFLFLIIFLLSISFYGQDIYTHNIYFSNSETELNKSDSEVLDNFLDSIEISPNCKLTVTGFADNLGDEKLNYVLSEKRAVSVKNYLLTKGMLVNNILTKASGPILDPERNKNEAQRKFNRRVEIIISCIIDKKEDLKSIATSIPNFENDTVIKGKNGTELKVKKGAFYPRKIKDIMIEIKELSTYCDSVPDDIETITENGICLASGGMAFISATYKKKPVRKSFEAAYEVKVPIQQNDTTMDFYIAVKQKNGKLRWRKSNGKIVTENGKKYYVYETNVLGAFNCDKIIPGCNVDNENYYIIKNWMPYSPVKFYLKDKFGFYKSREISKKRVAIPAGLSPDEIYIECSGIKWFSLKHFFGSPNVNYETKTIYKLSELKYNARKKQYKLRARNYKVTGTFGGKKSQLKEFMNCK